MCQQTQLPMWAAWLQAIGPVLISAFAVVVSVFSVCASSNAVKWQAYAEKEKIRQQYYDKRFEIFVIFRDLLMSTTQKTDISAELEKANFAKSGSVFLLDEYLAAFLNKIHDDAFKLNAKLKLLTDPSYKVSLSPKELIDDRNEITALQLELGNQLPKLAACFEPFLRPKAT